jgi:hypothetical protein
MGFQVVSITKHPLEGKHIVKKMLIKRGVIEYTGRSGQEANFIYEDTINYEKKLITVPLIRESISVTGRKYCYCIDRLHVHSRNGIVKYYPEAKFTYHPYNCYKYKDKSFIRAEVMEEKAYATDK